MVTTLNLTLNAFWILAFVTLQWTLSTGCNHLQHAHVHTTWVVARWLPCSLHTQFPRGAPLRLWPTQPRKLLDRTPAACSAQGHEGRPMGMVVARIMPPACTTHKCARVQALLFKLMTLV